MLKKVLVGAAVLVVLLLGLIAMQPNTFAVTRSGTIAAPPAIAFAQVNDFHQWSAWSPWAQLDPSMKTTFSGPPAGEGAIYEWTGNDEVGKGRMTILSSRPGEAIDLRLEFIEPFPSTALTQFTFAPEGDGTKVTWKMSGDNGFMGKAFGLVKSMDSMIGPDFEKGLAQLNVAAAAEAKKAATAAEAAAAEAAKAAADAPDAGTP